MARYDPLRNYKFKVDVGTHFDSNTGGGFQKVSGVGAEVDVITYREGNDKENHVRKMAGLEKYEEITLERGVVDNNTDLWDFMQKSLNEKSVDYGHPANKDNPSYRSIVTIYALNRANTKKKVWTLENAFCVSFKLGDMEASTNEVLISTLTIAYEKMKEATVPVVDTTSDDDDGQEQ